MLTGIIYMHYDFLGEYVLHVYKDGERSETVVGNTAINKYLKEKGFTEKVPFGEKFTISNGGDFIG